MIAKENHTSNPSWVLVTAVLASSMAFIDATALNVALPAIQVQTRATGAELFWIVNSYGMMTAALILLGGALGDAFGKKRILAIGISGFVLASIACGISPGIPSLVCARTLQGLGGALMIPGSLALISDTFPESSRGRAIGVWSACSVVMTALGPIMGGLLADAGWWRAIFFINLPVGVIALATLLGKVTVSDQDRLASVDYAGAVLGILALAGINFALLEVAALGWNDRYVISAMIGGLFFLAAFLRRESRSTYPLFPLELFRNRRFSAACQLTLCFYSAFHGLLFFLALNLIQVQGYSASTAGVAQLPVMLLVMLLAPLSGSWVDRMGPGKLLAVGGALGGLGFLLLARPGVGVRSYWNSFFPALCVLGAAMGMIVAPLSTTLMSSVPASRFGLASGINSMLSRLSAVMGIAVLGPIAMLTFRHSLMRRARSLALEDRWIIELHHEMGRLADTVPPRGMSADMSAAVQNGIHMAYIDAFRIVCCVSAGLVVASSLLAARMLKKPAVGA